MARVPSVTFKKNTNKTYNQTFTKFNEQFGSKEIKDLSSDDVLTFLNQNTEGKKQSTKRTRFSHLNAFFNFIQENTDLDFVNPCDNPMLKKIYKGTSIAVWDIMDKEIIDETIFRTTKQKSTKGSPIKERVKRKNTSPLQKNNFFSLYPLIVLGGCVKNKIYTTTKHYQTISTQNSISESNSKYYLTRIRYFFFVGFAQQMLTRTSHPSGSRQLCFKRNA